MNAGFSVLSAFIRIPKNTLPERWDCSYPAIRYFRWDAIIAIASQPVHVVQEVPLKLKRPLPAPKSTARPADHSTMLSGIQPVSMIQVVPVYWNRPFPDPKLIMRLSPHFARF